MQEQILINISLSEFKEIQKEWIQKVLSEIQPHKKNEEELLTRKETSKILGISLVTLNVYTKKGIVRGYRLGSRIRYKKEEVIGALQSMNKYERRRG